MDNLNSIINELAEKRMKDIIAKELGIVEETDSYSVGKLNEAVHKEIVKCVDELITKHKKEIERIVKESFMKKLKDIPKEFNLQIGHSKYY